MNDKNRRRFERLAGSSAFAVAAAADFTNTSKGGQAAAELTARIAEVEALETSRATSINSQQQATVGKSDGRASLRSQLRALSDTARTIALDHPEVKGSFKYSGASVGDHTLLATARAFAGEAVALKARFIEYDLPADFLAALNASISSFEEHLDNQIAGKGARVAANAAIEDALRRGEEALERLDTAVRNKYRGEPAKLAAWESASRLERAPRTKRPAATAAAVTTPVSPTPSSS